MPVPVRSSLVAPFSRTWRMRFRYSDSMVIIWVIPVLEGRGGVMILALCPQDSLFSSFPYIGRGRGL